MKDKRQRIAMAWPYAVYTDPTFAATVLQAAAASAHANGTLPDIAAIANAYQYSAAAAAAAAGPSYFHGPGGGGSGEYGKFQPQHYVGPVPPPPSAPPTQSLQQMMKKPFGPFVGHHHHHHHHHQFSADATAMATTTDASTAESSNGHHHAATSFDGHKTVTADQKTPSIAVENNKTSTAAATTSSSSSSSAADAADFSSVAAGTSCKCGIVDCVLTTSGKPVNNNGAMEESTPSSTDRLQSQPFFITSGAPETGRDDIQSAECSVAVHKHVYHKEYAKNKLFQPYKSDVTTAKLNL